jgi:capsular exopolysaccharide synthesis family protein
MSQIFDALQRSEAERSGENPERPGWASEFLKRTQDAATSNGRGADLSNAQNGVVDNATAAEDVRTAVEEPETAIPEPIKKEATEPTKKDTIQPASERVTSSAMAANAEFEAIKIVVPPESRLVVLPGNESVAGEAFHLLGVRLKHMRRLRPLKKVLVTSTIPQEGKSMVASNLACTLALRTQERILLLEGDVRRPTQSRIFGIPSLPGICEWLSGERSLAKSIYKLDGAGICILPAGSATGKSLEYLQSGKVNAMMEQLVNWFDWVVVDSPPILPLADTSVWTNLIDGILLVARQGITQKRQLKRGLEALGTQKVIGAVLNSAKSVAHTDYYYRPKTQLPNGEVEE